jgi:DNA-binding Lrp family transcriptional regulator
MALLEQPNRERGFTKERIIRVLLNHTGDNLTKYRLAQLADASESWTRQYTEKLEEKELIKGTEVVVAADLYRVWLEQRIEPNQLEISLQQSMDLLAETDLEYALTTYQAENLHQGFLFASSTDFYISPEDISNWLEIVEEKGLLGGVNTRIRVLDDHVFYNQQLVDEFSTVSVPQLILDLLAEGGPCEEAAEKLIDSYHGEQQW